MTPEEYETALALRRGQHVTDVIDVVLDAEKRWAEKYAADIDAWIASGDPLPEPPPLLSAGMTLLGH